MKTAYIISAVRTPIGSFGGQLAMFGATTLGSKAIEGALAVANLEAAAVEEIFMGNVVSANLGQAPARQAALEAGIPTEVPCTTVNKVCSSGMKSIMFAAQAIQLGLSDVIVAGGMESMSNIPYYVPNARWGYKYGGGQFIDGLQRDGLNDAYGHEPMGIYADRTAEKYQISREEQDAFAIQSYQRSAKATEEGKFKDEIIGVAIPQRKGDPVMMTEDEEFRRVQFDKIAGLRPAFSKDGTVTAANASTINDGAAAVVVASEEAIKNYNLTPIARIVSYADAAHEPEWFTTAPALAAPKALKQAGLDIGDMDYFEVNEAFAVVTMAFNKLLDVDPDRVNVHGGAVSLGH
ncbi:MAG: thiolase family protein, partial [Saprospiraceae bacterium]|nr:thiolase family protein [Saprospiraceae bacterium]